MEGLSPRGRTVLLNYSVGEFFTFFSLVGFITTTIKLKFTVDLYLFPTNTAQHLPNITVLTYNLNFYLKI